ncbi:mitochondrial 54S ribosomal protein [Saccharomycopsis crataegensis]|uniref:Mitochondrial 54S ribosomal protein n=1 Tax=Saccharomycopsis crataegensis TaxID=43959 RepID=A0AAV5QNM4_9ASCO|nr:mitochondrial 54S ribosomal protein [Saccharomycopsis crataegensis]
MFSRTSTSVLRTSISSCLGKPFCVAQRANYIVPSKKRRTIPVYEPLATAHGEKSGQLMDTVRGDLYQKFDPSGWRRELLNHTNKECLRAGDIVRVIFKDSLKNPSYVGYLMAIDRNGPDSTILLRSKVSQVGVERRFSIYNPFIERIDRVRKPYKYNQRNRHYYIKGSKRDASDYESLSKRTGL